MSKISKKKKQKCLFLLISLTVLTGAHLFSKSRRNRRWGVRPMNKVRQMYGHYQTLYKLMKLRDQEQFFNYTRMSVEQFNELLLLVKDHIQKDRKKCHISPEERLAITLHFLAQGCSQQELAWNYFLGKSTIHKIVIETCEVLWQVVGSIYLKPPTTDEFESIQDGFYKRWNMPNCIGAVDGKHVAIQSPKNSGSEFFNYKKHFSIVLMAACDSFYRFTMVDIGASGANHDGYVFRHSGFGNALLAGELNIPKACKLPNSGIIMNSFLVGDAAFPLHKNIMRPYPDKNLNETERIFNYRLSRARNCIENSFGILCQRWRILRKTIVADVKNCEHFVKAAIVLHNFVQRKEEDIPPLERRYCPTGFSDYVDNDGTFHYGQWRQEFKNLKSVGRLGSNNSKTSEKIARDNLASWFISEGGDVPWQQIKILEGSLPE